MERRFLKKYQSQISTNVTADVFSIETKSGPLIKVEPRSSYVHKGVVGSSTSFLLSEVLALIDIGKQIIKDYPPIVVAPTPRAERVVYNKTPPSQSTVASSTQYEDQQYSSQQLSSSSNNFNNEEDIPF